MPLTGKNAGMAESSKGDGKPELALLAGNLMTVDSLMARYERLTGRKATAEERLKVEKSWNERHRQPTPEKS
ncbi:hypothetical protein FHP25_32570 [Vineibacter terrae]|uniref:Uncharacterized protein n=1 Tax=Vineibacter terrae TaxID=2586908 RepID=A0A5C8PAN0_9HYPH|nr:hypothetical protein [Vineibacter terrae]TXL70856.1 hypothetical protein FHP25_32570 [Vineibacter terrae]